jgi:ureidoacrylate peracid hydrolase
VCCEATARDAMMLDFKVVMVSDCCAALSDEEHQASLETIIQQFGDVLTRDEVLARLDGRSNVSSMRAAARPSGATEKPRVRARRSRR